MPASTTLISQTENEIVVNSPVSTGRPGKPKAYPTLPLSGIVPPPVENDPDALAILALHRGPDALAECVDYVRQCDARLAELAAQVVQDSEAIEVRAFLARAEPILALRKNYAERAAVLARILGQPTPELPEMLDVDRVAGFGLDDSRDRLVDEAVRLHEELGRAERDLAAIGVASDADYFAPSPPDITNRDRRAPKRPPEPCAADRLLTVLNPIVRSAREHRTKLALCEGSRDKAASTQAQLVTEAVQAAGGVDAVVNGLMEASAIAGRFGQGDPEAGQFALLQRWLTDAQGVADRLRSTVGEEGMLAASQAETIAATRQLLSEARARIAARHRENLTDQVRQACEGVEISRAWIAELAASFPSAFRQGFAQAIQEAKWETAQRLAFRRLVAPNIEKS
jgi:hypothetical protein